MPLDLRSRNVIVLYTDGITKAAGTASSSVKPGSTPPPRHRQSGAGVADALLADALAYQGGTASDDVAVVTVTVS